MNDWPWTEPGGDLSAVPDRPGGWSRVVACLNVWNDVEELRANWDSWYPFVDHVIAVDGVYAGTNVEKPYSTDGTLEFLAKHRNVEIRTTDTPWKDQRVKRTAYFEYGQAGDLLFVVDADEYVEGGVVLRSVPALDVGWVSYRSPVYQRSQHTPRLFRWRPGLRYAGRHHWIYCGDTPVTTHQQGAAGWEHRAVDLSFWNSRGGHRPTERQQVVSAARIQQVEEEWKVGEHVTAHEPLRIVQSGPFDPGNVVYRLHSAINTTTPHTSVMATGHMGPYNPPRQYDFERDRLVLRDLITSADVMHYHVMRVADKYVGVNPPRIQVMHHHGTEYRRDPELWNQCDHGMALRLVSNVELLQYGEGLQFLPNPVPVARYRRLWNPPKRGVFRLAHSPSKPSLKGTSVLVSVVERLQREGLPIELVLIQDVSLKESLAQKATCHACFDSFWLGMQCSGLEAAAMGMPVLAGDLDCKREYEELEGEVPYTWVSDTTLADVLAQLATNKRLYQQEANRVHQYVTMRHDYGAVTAHYLALLQSAAAWRDVMAI